MERRQLQVAHVPERLAPPDQLGLVRAVGGLGHGVVVGVADRAGRGQHPVLAHARGVHRADVLGAVVGVVDEPPGAAVPRGPGDRLLQRLQGQLLGVHAGGARPSHDAAGEYVGDERSVAEPPVRHAHVGDVGHVQPVRRHGSEPALHEVGPAARALRRPGGRRRPAAPDALYAELAHDVHHLVAADLGRIPPLGEQLGMDLPVSVHGHEEIRMDPEDVPGQRLVARLHAAGRPGLEHAVAARREKPAIRRRAQHPADRPDPETIPMRVDVRGHQGRVGSSRAAKKADAVVKISFARRSSAFSARRRLSSAIASCADCSDCSAADASDWFRQRRSVSDETPGSLATSAIAFVSDEYEGRDSVNSLTAFALNSSVYLVPLDMIPSSPIELGEMRNKNQAISDIRLKMIGSPCR